MATRNETNLKCIKCVIQPFIRLKQLLTQRSGFVRDKKAHEHRMKELLVMINFKAGDQSLNITGRPLILR